MSILARHLVTRSTSAPRLSSPAATLTDIASSGVAGYDGLPATQLLAGGAHHVLLDPLDQAALHRHGQEVQRRDQAADRVLPANQGLGAEDLAGSQLDDRLVVEDELALVQRGFELLGEVRVGRCRRSTPPWMR